MFTIRNKQLKLWLDRSFVNSWDILIFSNYKKIMIGNINTKIILFVKQIVKQCLRLKGCANAFSNGHINMPRIREQVLVCSTKKKKKKFVYL